MANLTYIIEDKTMPTNTTVTLVQWFFQQCSIDAEVDAKESRKKIDALELWTWRRLLRIPRTARMANANAMKLSTLCKL
jgi:hypothetical protein